MSEKDDRWLFCFTYLLFGTLIAGTILAMYLSEFRQSRNLIVLEEQIDLEFWEKRVRLEFGNVISDTLFLTMLDSLKPALETGDYSAVERDFISFILAKPTYGQLRFINEKGMEIVRINNQDRVVQSVSPDQLQKKNQRYYVQETMGLPEGEVYVSPLDLNVENGIIETPHVPMVRFASPVFINNVRRGMIVINHRATLMLEELRSYGVKNKGDFFLLDQEGYYMVSSVNREDEWGFMFPEKYGKKYPLQDPEHWEQIQKNESFQYKLQSRIVSSRVIRPLNALNVTANNYYWIVLSMVTEQQISKNIHLLLVRFFLFGAALFLLSVIPAWAISRCIVQYRQTKKNLYKSAHYDELTALPSRHLFNDRLGQVIIHTRRYNHSAALLFIDLDRFKKVNDNFGHETGDKLLQEVSKRLDTCIRKSDTAARFGGDEFVVLMPNENNLKGVEVLAEKLIQTISMPYRIADLEISISASIGIRIFSSESDTTGETVTEILKDADAAMYKAKNRGEGHFSIWQDSSCR